VPSTLIDRSDRSVFFPNKTTVQMVFPSSDTSGSQYDPNQWVFRFHVSNVCLLFYWGLLPVTVCHDVSFEFRTIDLRNSRRTLGLCGSVLAGLAEGFEQQPQRPGFLGLASGLKHSGVGEKS